MNNETSINAESIRRTSFDPDSIRSLINQIDDFLAIFLNENNPLIPNRVRRLLFSIAHYKDKLRNEINNGSYDPNVISEITDKLALRSEEMLMKAAEQGLDEHLFKLLHELANIINKNTATQRNRENIGNSFNGGDFTQINKNAAALEILTTQLASIQNEIKRTRSTVAGHQKQADRLETQIGGYNNKLQDLFDESKVTISTILGELEKKQTEVNNLVGTITGTTIAGSYDNSASVEKSIADWMRLGSIGLMLAVVSIIGYSLLETGKPHFEWETALFRLFFSLTLSVPAAYLARESSKHREQQYAYLRVSLDLQAITPYLASLPLEEQHKLKVEVASRIFGNKDAPRDHNASYPLNLNDIVMGLIQKIPVQKEKDTDKN